MQSEVSHQNNGVDQRQSPIRIITNEQSDTFKVVKRAGEQVSFDANKIKIAITKTFVAVEGQSAVGSRRVHEIIDAIAEQVVTAVTRRNNVGGLIYIEDIQDHVELALMREGHHKVARAYVLYREKRSEERRSVEKAEDVAPDDQFSVISADGDSRSVSYDQLRADVEAACKGLSNTDSESIYAEVRRNIYNGMREDEFAICKVMAARTLIETEPNYSFVASRFLLAKLSVEAKNFVFENTDHYDTGYSEYFPAYISRACALDYLNPEMKQFDLEKLTAALKPERDLQFQYLGLQTLYDRYFLHSEGTRFELPQAFFMRVAMGLALAEVDREDRAIEFYNLLSSFDFMCSTPTLFNSGTVKSQLSSCFLTTISDDLDNIFKSVKDNALLSKFAGGIGNDWTPVRGMGSHIKGTNGQSQGVIPFLKVANDTAVAVNQGGKRKGAVCGYLETWHIDIEEFLDLRKNTGDERRRTHDMNTANWVPDLFMKRVEADGSWTLFSPDETADLHDLYGKDFEEKYCVYEEKAERGEIRIFKKVKALDLWRRMLTMLFETGHPWVTFKDPCNLRSPQQHKGVVHSSNLCTEITLNTSKDEIAVCNLGSLNLAAHIIEKDGQVQLDHDKLAKTLHVAMRMLDNVIDINYYTVPEARRSNLRHRPVGLGLMGFQDALYKFKIPYASDEAVEFADSSMEAISYHVLTASCELARERGRYPSFEGSLWSEGVLPIDSIEYLDEARDGTLEQNRDSRLDWDSLRLAIGEYGLRNSNTMAIAPTATISNICGVSQSIEPTYQNLYVKSNMSGEFTIVNEYLVRDLKEKGLWDEVMISDLKYFDGSLGSIDRIPNELKELYATAFEIDSSWLIEAASRRQKWIDQAQSLNLYIAKPSGRKLDELYRLAWKRGLKTTYYLRSMSASHVEKSTLKGTDGKLNAVGVSQTNAQEGQVCSIDDPECEACQ